MLKRITILIICLYLLGGSSVIFFGEELRVVDNPYKTQIITPYMKYISDGFCLISNSKNGIAKIDCTVNGYRGITTKINITTSLQQYKNGVWQTIRKFDESVNSHSITLNKEVPVEKGYSYRVTTLVRAYSGERFEVQILRSKEMKF